MAEKIFRFVGEQPIPQPPSDEVADNHALFDLEGASRRSGWSTESLILLHELIWPPSTPVDVHLVLSEAEAMQQALAGWHSDPDKVLIRAHDFGWVKDPEFALFLAKCRQRRVNPWARQAFPEFRFNSAQKRLELVLIVALEVKRLIAHSTGTYAGIGRPQFEYGDSDRPVSCWITIKRVVNGQIRKFIGAAEWLDFYPGANSGSLWDSKPHVCLATCAESNGLNKAFPAELGDVYTSFEFNKPRDPSGTGAASISSPQQSGQVTLTEEEIPATSIGFHRALWEMGFGDPNRRQALIEQFRLLHPGLLERDDRGFYAIVLTELRRNPVKWGVEAG